MTRRYRTKTTDGPRDVIAGKLRCRACSEVKPPDAYRLLRNGSRGSWCKPCANAANRAWRARNRDALQAARQAAYRAAHPPRPTYTCRRCGETFTTAARSGPPPMYCSDLCKERAAHGVRVIARTWR